MSVTSPEALKSNINLVTQKLGYLTNMSKVLLQVDRTSTHTTTRFSSETSRLSSLLTKLFDQLPDGGETGENANPPPPKRMKI